MSPLSHAANNDASPITVAPPPTANPAKDTPPPTANAPSRPDIPRYIFDPTFCFGLDADEVSILFAELQEYPDRQHAQIISNYDSGRTIAEVIENIRHLPYEVTVVFDREYRKVLDFTCYTENACCCYYPEYWREHLQVMIHNHPNTNWDFSDDDLVVAAASGCPTHIVVCKNYTFVIEHWPRDWSTEAPAQIRDVKALEKFIKDDHACLIKDLIAIFQQSGLRTTYSIYNLKGKCIYHLPANTETINSPKKSPSTTVIPDSRALEHLRYLRRYG